MSDRVIKPVHCSRPDAMVAWQTGWPKTRSRWYAAGQRSCASVWSHPILLGKALFDFVKSGVLIAIIAHGLIGISLIWDKVLLKRPGTQNLFSYVFWLGSMSVFGVCLVPFGYGSPSAGLMALAFGAGVIHLGGNFFYYAALKRGEASETLAIMGGFSPVATAALAFALLSRQMTRFELVGFLLMTAGGFVMFFAEKLPLRRLLPPVLLASGLLGLVNVLEKVVYDRTNFVTGYVWFTIGTFIGALLLLIPPSWRKQIFSEAGQDEARNRFWYFLNRFFSGVGSFLIFYAISLAHPAVVDSISGVRYAIIFLGALLLTKFRPIWLEEKFGRAELTTKIIATCLVVAGLVVVGRSEGAGNSGSPRAERARGEIKFTRLHCFRGPESSPALLAASKNRDSAVALSDQTWTHPGD
jgi:drug/metabolite transporter (DMT)-like permease